MNIDRTDIYQYAKYGGEYSKNQYSPILKTIITLAYTNSVQHNTFKKRKVSKNFQLDLFSVVLSCPQQWACAHSWLPHFHAQFMQGIVFIYLQFAQGWRFCKTNFEDFKKIGNPRKYPLKLTGQNCSSSYQCFEIVP